MTKALVLPVADVKALAEHIVDSKLWPVKNYDEAFALMMICQAEGVHPIMAMQRYDIIQGRPAKKSSAMLADFQAAGGKMKWLERTDKACAAEFMSPALTEPLTVRFTMEDADRAGLAHKDNYKKHPRKMLSARVVSEGVGLAWAGARILHTPEEVENFEPPGSTLDAMEARAKEQADEVVTQTPESIDGYAVAPLTADGKYFDVDAEPVNEPSSAQPGENDVECWIWKAKTKNREPFWQSTGFEPKHTPEQMRKMYVLLKEAEATEEDKHTACAQVNKESTTQLSVREMGNIIDRLQKKLDRAEGAREEIENAGVGREPGAEG